MVMPGTRNPNAEGHPPSPPSKGGKSEAKGGCYPFKGGKERSEGGMLSLQRGEERSEAHEALTFWLLLGQAKSNGKNALNNKRNE